MFKTPDNYPRPLVLPVIEPVRKATSATHDAIWVTDLPGLAAMAAAVPADFRLRKQCDTNGRSWADMSYAAALDGVRIGNLSGVAASDEFMSKLEAQRYVSHSWRTVAAVAGGAVNVAAHLAGQPMSMRRRERLQSAQSPLAIVADLTSSGGISSKDLQKRGAAILALVRLLSAHRPVTLYAGCCMTPHGQSNAGIVMARIDTAPIDLARAAHVFTSSAVARGIMYSAVTYGMMGADGTDQLHWPYSNVDLFRRHAPEIIGRALPFGSECLYVPPVFYSDEAITQPEKWLSDMLAKYGNAATEEAA